MKTEYVDLRDGKAVKEDLYKAAQIIKNGGLVAFPTETVYGLGANGLDENAVPKIYEAKGRPSDNPLILHISEFDEIKSLVKAYMDRDDDRFKTIVLQIAAHEAKLGHDGVARDLKSHIEKLGKSRKRGSAHTAESHAVIIAAQARYIRADRFR